MEEPPDVPWEMDEYWTEETKDRSMTGWMLHKGLLIGRKMLVTGMIISSAPVVLPPLVVISALSFAVSVPYGIILASYTCSEKILDKLLPGTSPPFSLEAHEDVDDDRWFSGAIDMEDEQEKSTDERMEDLNVWMKMSRASEEPGGEVVVGYQETYRYSPMTEEPAVMRIEEVVPTAESLEHDLRNSEIVEASVEITDVVLMDDVGGKGDNLGRVLVEETKGLIIELGAEGSAADSVPVNDPKLEHEVIDKMEIPTEAKTNGKKSKRKGRKKEKVDERKPPKASNETAEIKNGSVQPVTAGTDAKKDHHGQAKDDKIHTSEKVLVQSPIGPTVPEVEINLDRDVTFPSLNEGKDAEEAIWQRIEAVRRIVGYKAARQATCIEELRSLYLFTGVEPPVSFKGTSDLAEVNEKLQFLLSVVGVK